jgi:hypothetical protein
MPVIGDQDIYISPVGYIKRTVYDIRSDDKWNIQTGYVLYGNNVAVWRPYDPKEVALVADWRENIWLPIYTNNVSFDPDFDYRKCETYWHSVDDDFIVKLPTARSTITMQLKNHLVAVYKEELARSKAKMSKWRAKVRRKYGIEQEEACSKG